MATITFENGKKVKFEGTPTPQDVEEVANSLGLSKSQPPAPTPAPEKTFMQKAGGVLDTVFGGGKVGELIGTQIAKRSDAGKELARQEASGIAPKGSVDGTFKKPTAGQVAGSAAQAALTFAPVGRIAKGIGTVATKLGVTPKLAKFAGAVGAGGGTGYGYDVASGVAQGEANPLEAGGGTAIGAGLPFVPPVLKGVGRLAGEGLGVSTGTGYGTIKTALSSASKGGKEAEALKSAMRGDVSPDQIVEEARSALGKIVDNRTKAYRSQLSKLETNTKKFSTEPIIDEFNKMLDDFGVTFTDKGLPDFTRSPGLGRYEKDLAGISRVLENWGTREGDNSVVGIDKLKQVLDDFRIGSADSRKFDSFVTTLRNKAKTLIRNEPGYEKLVTDYENSTGLINEIKKGLSLGDKAQTDTAFRKLTGVLRTNNEFRKQLVDELDELTGGTLTPKIAGQQLSEVMPRGLVRPIGGIAGVGGLASGVGIVPILTAALFTSPRLVGMILRAIGYPTSKIKKVLEVIAPKGFQFPGDTLFDEVMGNKLPKTPPKLGQSLSTNTARQSIDNAPSTQSPRKITNKLNASSESDVMSPSLPRSSKKSIGAVGASLKSKKAPLATEARKYKSAEEFGLDVKKGGHLLDSLPKTSVDTAKIDSRSLGKDIQLDTRDLGKQTTGKLTSNYWLKKIQNGERPPILVGVQDGKLKVIDGNHRATAYVQQGIKDVPVIYTNEAKSQLTDIYNKAHGK